MAAALASAQGDASTVRFVLDGETIELRDVEPTRTVLQFLREDLDRTGTKEGCAEGDCGACTTVLAELTPDGDGLRLRAINSCIQFLPTLDGKELITVESLAGPDGELHPVQRAMVECHASQCGFCTPGFVMSLFALYKNGERPGRRQIDDALAGNLCRCTGYRPIIAAAQRMYDYAAGDDWLQRSAHADTRPDERIARLAAIAPRGMLSIERDGRRFFAPTTVAELAQVLGEFPDATLLAGGTDVGLWVTKQYRDLGTVIYTGRVRELTRIDVGDETLGIGAAVTLSDALPVLLDHFPELSELMLRFASPPIRNAATLGGNVANGSPIGDSMPALMVLGTTLTLMSATGSREVALDAFYHDYMVNDLEPGEFVAKLAVPLRNDKLTLRSYKVSKRFDQDISAVCAAFAIEFDGDRVVSARVAYGGMAATVKRAAGCEQRLEGQPWSEQTIVAAAAALAHDFEPISDMRSTADYRMRVAQNLLTRLYAETRGITDTSAWDYGRTA